MQHHQKCYKFVAKPRVQTNIILCPQAAAIRIGLMEMVKYVREFGDDTPDLATFFESCGVADLVSSRSVLKIWLHRDLAQF